MVNSGSTCRLLLSLSLTTFRPPGVWLPERAVPFSPLQNVTSRRGLKPVQPPIRSVSRVNQPGTKSDHSPPSTVVVKNKWSYTYTPITHLHDLDRDNFTFTYSMLRK